ncbi:Uncharacterized protein Fot_23686 [Forsythia ovata]|uniref:Uncharacterized protein n=1 Tax=Forsythia ovata TaxID=205694 RepID=A0ABD1V1A8_9LAMI
MGIFSNMKKQVIVPEEFHFAIDKRMPPPAAVVDLFDKGRAQVPAHGLACEQNYGPACLVSVQRWIHCDFLSGVDDDGFMRTCLREYSVHVTLSSQGTLLT